MSFNTNLISRQSWSRLSGIVRRRDNEICQYCEEAAPSGEPDHILPLDRGGRDSLDNLVWSCRRCNREKQGRTLREWIKEIRVLKKAIISPPKPIRSNGAEECKIWLLGILKSGDYPVNFLRAEAKKVGYSENVLGRAKMILNADSSTPRVESIRRPKHWEWHLVEGDADANT